jgi:hypothetical protein
MSHVHKKQHVNHVMVAPCMCPFSLSATVDPSPLTTHCDCDDIHTLCLWKLDLQGLDSAMHGEHAYDVDEHRELVERRSLAPSQDTASSLPVICWPTDSAFR